MKRCNIVLFLMIFLQFSNFLPAEESNHIILNNRKKVGLCIVATGRYDHFIAPLVDSARKYFCPNQDVTYFVFTDGTIPQAPDIVRIEQKRLGWPYDTMMRFEIYAANEQPLKKMDYLFACDADMLFVDTVGDEILSKFVGTQHPGFVNKRGSYETNPKSLAYVPENKGKIYFAGGFWGGFSTKFLKVCNELNRRIHVDLSNNIIPVWHDESHLNRYCIDHPPTKVLSPSYCYPENWSLPYHRRLLALDKNHSEMRKNLSWISYKDSLFKR
jgi:histo-blood group ABO system transferase